MTYSYKRIILATMILLGIILAFVGWRVNLADGLKGGEPNVFLVFAKMSATAGWSYLIIDAIINYLERRKVRNR